MLFILFIEALAFVLQIIYFSACGCYTVISGFPFWLESCSRKAELSVVPRIRAPQQGLQAVVVETAQTSLTRPDCF